MNKRFHLIVDTFGSFWRARDSNNFKELLKLADQYKTRVRWICDQKYGFNYHFLENEWSKIGRIPRSERN